MNIRFCNKYIVLSIFVFLLLASSITIAQDSITQQNIVLNGFFCGEWEDIESEIGDISKTSLELQWPQLNDQTLNEIVDKEQLSLGEVINYFYSLSLWLAVVVGFLSIIFVGFAYIQSGSNPEKRKQALEKARNIFFGTVILMSSVIVLNFINPELKELNSCYETGDCKIGLKEAEKINLPKSSVGIGPYLKQSYAGDYSGIPYTNNEGANLLYENILPSRYFRGSSNENCVECNTENSYNQDSNKMVASLTGADNYPDPLCDFYCDEGRDRIKDFLEHGCYTEHSYSDLYNITASKYIIVEGSGSATPVNCAAVCMANSLDDGASCKGESGSEAFYSWLDNRIDLYKEKTSDRESLTTKIEGVYNRQYKTNIGFLVSRPRNSYLLDIFEDSEGDKIIDRKKFRECIGDNYVIDSQNVSGIEGSVCFCK